MVETPHASVLLEPVLDALRPRPSVAFHALDATVGAGGHSFALLEASSPDGRLVGLDADPAALDLARQRLAPFGERFELFHRNFSELGDLDLEPFDAIVFDLGLSSMQLDHGGRGFSFRADEPLDMRFDAQVRSAAGSPSSATTVTPITRPASSIAHTGSGRATAEELLASLSEVDLERILRDYGEEPRARRVARSIVYHRQRHPLRRTGDLVAAVTSALGPARGRIHPATRTFQALRIAVNDELGALESGLDAALRVLNPGGRLAVISFHSLEDRIVKWRFRNWAEAGSVQILTRKPIVPAEAETHRNPRARSAKLRVAERTA